MSMEVAHLRYAAAAAQHRSFRRAAVLLNITQPTLSKRIRELEARLGVTLFQRSTGGASLTAEGEAFVAGALRVLAELDRMERRAKAGRNGDVGRLDIGLYTSLSAGALRETILSFGAAYPDVDVNLNAHERKTLISLLDRGTIDIAIVLGEPTHRDYAYARLWSDRIMVAFPEGHPLANRDSVYWTDIRNERFLLSIRDPGPEIEDILLSKLASPGERPVVTSINAAREDVLSLVSGNRGISLICESATGNVMPRVVYCEVRDGSGPTRVGFVAYWRHNNENPVLKQFLLLLRGSPFIPVGHRANGG